MLPEWLLPQSQLHTIRFNLSIRIEILVGPRACLEMTRAVPDVEAAITATIRGFLINSSGDSCTPICTQDVSRRVSTSETR